MESRLPLRSLEDPGEFVLQPFLENRPQQQQQQQQQQTTVAYGRLQNMSILPMDQMKASHAENHYVENPIAVQPGRGFQAHSSFEHQEPVLPALPWTSLATRPSSIVSSTSSSSDQRLLDHVSPSPASDQGCPRASRPSPCKGPQPKGTSHGQEDGKRALLCECCGKCKCAQCTSPRTLPFCWMCGQVCLCSPQSLVNYATCMCLVKGLFYHCINEDDEGSCSDHPCSCTHTNCCARWLCMGAMSVFLPCLLCYLPAMGCVKLSQKFYDTVSRPGCRCKNSNSVYCKVPESPACNGGEKPP